MGQVDLLSAFQSPEANDIVNFSLEILPSVLETKTRPAAGTAASFGYSGIGTRGSIDSMVLSELAWDDAELARRIADNELLYYAREQSRDEHGECTVCWSTRPRRCAAIARPSRAGWRSRREEALAEAKMSSTASSTRAVRDRPRQDRPAADGLRAELQGRARSHPAACCRAGTELELMKLRDSRSRWCTSSRTQRSTSRATWCRR